MEMHIKYNQQNTTGPGVKDKNKRKEEREAEPEKEQAVPEKTTTPPDDEKQPRVNEDEQHKIVNNPSQGNDGIDEA